MLIEIIILHNNKMERVDLVIKMRRKMDIAMILIFGFGNLNIIFINLTKNEIVFKNNII